MALSFETLKLSATSLGWGGVVQVCVPFPDTSRAGRALASQRHPDSFSASVSRRAQSSHLTSGSFATFSSVFARFLSSVSSDLQKKDENAIFRGYSWFPVK